MKHAVEIRKPTRSAFEAADNEPLRQLLDEMFQAVSAGANWRVRKKTLLDLFVGLEAATIALHREAVRAGEPGVDPDADPSRVFLQTLPVYLAAILERLEEPRITCIEQAAFYMISAHPEHQDAAQAWIEADFKHFKEYKRFLAANRDYRDLTERGADLASGL